jgi:hypothetical protein
MHEFKINETVFNTRTRKWYKVTREGYRKGCIFARRLIGGREGAEYGSEVQIKAEYCRVWDEDHQSLVIVNY